MLKSGNNQNINKAALSCTFGHAVLQLTRTQGSASFVSHLNKVAVYKEGTLAAESHNQIRAPQGVTVATGVFGLD